MLGGQGSRAAVCAELGGQAGTETGIGTGTGSSRTVLRSQIRRMWGQPRHPSRCAGPRGMDPCCPALHPQLLGALWSALPGALGSDEGGGRVPSTPLPIPILSVSPASSVTCLEGAGRCHPRDPRSRGRTIPDLSRVQWEVPVPGFSNASPLLKYFQGFPSRERSRAPVPRVLEQRSRLPAQRGTGRRQMRAVGGAAATGEGEGGNSPSEEKICGQVTPRQGPGKGSPAAGHGRAGGGGVGSEGLLRGQSCFPWGGHLGRGVFPPGRAAAAVTQHGEAAGRALE